jgi:hypothetical protein
MIINGGSQFKFPTIKMTSNEINIIIVETSLVRFILMITYLTIPSFASASTKGFGELLQYILANGVHNDND